MKQVLVLVNPKSGMGNAYRHVTAIEKVWDIPENDVSFQFSQSAEDGAEKVRRAIDRGTDVVLVVGGDGMVNTIGNALLGSGVPLGVIPAGSGNGFARHFRIPMQPEAAARALLRGSTLKIDVGEVDTGETLRRFFITCSMAWDAALTEKFEQYPFRGLVPYILAGAQKLIEYKPQPFSVEMDGEKLDFAQPLIFTVANLSQFGNDFFVAPEARADSGDLELVAVERKDVPLVLSRIRRLIEHTFHELPQVTNRHFKQMTIRRENAAPLQIDGEVLPAGREVRVRVLPGTLDVLAPPELV